MIDLRPVRCLGFVLLLAAGVPAGVGAPKSPRTAAAIDYNRDIRPILSDTCYACHGPDQNKRKAGLRLDLPEGAFKALESGEFAIVPGDSQRSELIRRITATDEDDRMPPAKSGKTLAPDQIRLLRAWVDQGAPWKGHWAYLKPEQPPVPEVRNRRWPRNAIDYFILSRLEKAGLAPSREADKIRLIRRLTFDLTGLPPTPGEVDAFLADKSPEAYGRLVDRLLASPQYGERMAMFWLDLARYADTNGYHIDNHRDIWKWREWVIAAFNRNLPFDRFTIEQLAGDLLPNPTLAQRIATGFNRNEMVNFEGGADPDEYQTKYVVGRIDTTSKVFLGTTMACAECHDHKFDPISQREFYQFYAFFNTVAEKGLDGQKQSPAPRLQLPTIEEKTELERLKRDIAGMETNLKRDRDEPHPDRDAAQLDWETATRGYAIEQWSVLAPVSMRSENGARLEAIADQSVLASGTNPDQDVYEIVLETREPEITGLRIEALTHEGLPGQRAGRSENGAFLLSGLEVNARSLARLGDTNAWKPPAYGSWHAIGPFKADSPRQAFTREFGPEKDLDLEKSYDDGKLKWTARPEWKDGAPQNLPEADNAATYLFRTITAAAAQEVMLSLGSDDGLQVWLNGGKIFANDVARGVAPDQDRVRARLVRGENKLLLKINNGGGGYGFYFNPIPGPVTEYPVVFSAAVADASQKDFPAAAVLDDKPQTGWSLGDTNEIAAADRRALFVAQQPFGFSEGTEIRVRLKFESDRKQHALGRFRLALSSAGGLAGFAALPEEIRTALFAGRDQQSTNQTHALRRYYRDTFVAEVKELASRLAKEKEAREKLDQSILNTMVMEEMEKPRETHVLVRGDFRNKGDLVSPDVPRVWPRLPEGVPANRLALAQWLVSADQPLTSRVTVNRFWQNYFGTGLVKTANDFGSQGEWPSHPELLDWLAAEFMASGWDIKAMQKLIVTSATYRQDSRVTPELLERDPYNRLLTRGPRYRLEAEVIRDNALAISGLLDRRIGGPSVRPYQPPGLWEAIGFFDNGNFSSQRYVPSKGEDLFRRGIYTYWKRSLPYPSFFTFDAPNREVCTVQRPRTSTPLQALVLMNDPVYVEAARVFACRIMAEGGATVRQRLEFAFRETLARPPTKKELRILERIFAQQLAHYRQDKEAAAALTSIGESPRPEGVDVSEWAAWTAIGNVLLNLDETITKS